MTEEVVLIDMVGVGVGSTGVEPDEVVTEDVVLIELAGVGVGSTGVEPDEDVTEESWAVVPEVMIKLLLLVSVIAGLVVLVIRIR